MYAYLADLQKTKKVRRSDFAVFFKGFYGISATELNLWKQKFPLFRYFLFLNSLLFSAHILYVKKIIHLTFKFFNVTFYNCTISKNARC